MSDQEVGRETGREKTTAFEPIQFKPLSEGLGFHPFSDGLPYAPQVPKPAQIPTPQRTGMGPGMGTGAESAGPPRFAYPRTVTAPPVAPAPTRLPVTPPLSLTPQAAAPVITNFSRPHTGPYFVTPSGAASVAPPLASRLPEPLAALEYSQNQRGFLYVVRRTLAWFVDTSIHFTLGFCGLAGVLWNQPLLSPSSLDMSVLLLVGGFLTLLNWALITSQEVIFKTTFGKRLFNLQLDSSNPLRIFLRSLVWILSVGFFGLGIVWSLFDAQRRCWHDLATGTDVAEI